MGQDFAVVSPWHNMWGKRGGQRKSLVFRGKKGERISLPKATFFSLSPHEMEAGDISVILVFLDLRSICLITTEQSDKEPLN
jgi:hypothetical protein